MSAPNQVKLNHDLWRTGDAALTTAYFGSPNEISHNAFLIQNDYEDSNKGILAISFPGA
jgi:hypothetical protein